MWGLQVHHAVRGCLSDTPRGCSTQLQGSEGCGVLEDVQVCSGKHPVGTPSIEVVVCSVDVANA